MTDRPPPVLARRLATACLLATFAVTAGCASGTKGGPQAASLGAVTTKPGSSASFIAALGNGILGPATVARLGTADRQRALEAEYRALEAAPGGQPVAWQGGNVRGSVVATAPYQVGSQNCRQYSHTVTIGAAETTARGVACRNTDGTWTPLT